MRLTKYSHSCVRLDKGSATLVIDPGMFSESAAALDGADGVLITHEHQDHIDAPAVLAAAAANPELRVWGPASVTAMLSELGDRAIAVGGGETFDAAGFSVKTFGGLHALIHPLVGTLVANNACLVDDAVYHPGDSFTVPPVPVEVLLIPVHAPWSKIGEVIDFAAAVRAPRAYQIHDALLNANGSGLVDRLLTGTAAAYGTTYQRLASGESVEV